MQNNNDFLQTRMSPVYHLLNDIGMVLNDNRSDGKASSILNKTANLQDLMSAVLIEAMPYLAGVAGAGEVIVELQKDCKDLKKMAEQKSQADENIKAMEELISKIQNQAQLIDS